MSLAMSKNLSVVFYVLLISVFGVVFACNGGYKLKVRKIQNCAGAEGILIPHENGTAVLTKKCEIKMRGCVEMKAFKQATVKYAIKKDGVKVMEGSEDLCERMENARSHPTIGPMMKTLNLPEKCPVQAGTICSDPTQIISIEPYKQMLSLARGRIEVEAEIQHDTGKSCIRMQFDIVK
ncbi:uncharacterized protein LOC129748806 [Uranotaenia lowii]|uniref:uncharacterized protein LOC129743998 n=1 Tax=Uranotaenia lowii TaxID=190385 RepID=UPI002478B3D8|nr:uncharacterized protein LOC129743998 [Uranotaenia lowii]XP_055599532.1 uncharacterized protein LOC129748806 [Uranotaenia lowii]